MSGEGVLAETAVKLAVSVVAYYRWMLEVRKEFVMSRQILKSGTSIGANIHEANYAISRADFISKMQIALKEAAETEYWIIVLEKTGYKNEELEKIRRQCNAVKRMLISTLNTSKSNV